ncbi:MAG: phospholipid scramblase-related protein [bacterium]
MKQALNRNVLFVTEHPCLFKRTNNYDILDPETKELLMECREEKISRLTRLLRFTSLRRTTPFTIIVRTVKGDQVLRMSRGVPIFASVVNVFDETNAPIGCFKQRPFSFSGAFDVLDAQNRPLCTLKSGQAGWNFRFLSLDDIELARVTRKWAGFGRELFTSANDYILQLDDVVPEDSLIRQLVLASALCIGLIQKTDIP